MSSRSNKPLDVTKLKGLVIRLQEAITAYEENSGNDLYLDSLIKRFELPLRYPASFCVVT